MRLMNKTPKVKFHFMGIGGSGMSGAALLGLSFGYDIDGCDAAADTPYTAELENKIPVFVGHSKDHITASDVLVVSPSILFQKPEPEELTVASKVMTWQAFLGKYLQSGKETISVCGTHGKSTTTSMLALVFEAAGLDPSVMVGAKVPAWGTNYRAGKGKLFIVEGDEFFENFLNYSPEVVILNNIEFDHPDFFNSEENIIQSFTKHISSLHGKKAIVVNKDATKAYDLAQKIGNGLRIISYSTKDTSADFFGKINKADSAGTSFAVNGKNYFLKIPGEFNVSNALGVIAAASIYSVKPQIVIDSLAKFAGIGRRLELIAEKNEVVVYDDYAHHPTAIRETLKALRQKYPDAKIHAVVEPHSYSRTSALLPLYEHSFDFSDDVIIAPIFKARDTKKFGISEASIVRTANHNNITSILSFDGIVKKLKHSVKKGDVVVVMGAGNSYKLARQIANEL